MRIKFLHDTQRRECPHGFDDSHEKRDEDLFSLSYARPRPPSGDTSSARYASQPPQTHTRHTRGRMTPKSPNGRFPSSLCSTLASAHIKAFTMLAVLVLLLLLLGLRGRRRLAVELFLVEILGLFSRVFLRALVKWQNHLPLSSGAVPGPLLLSRGRTNHGDRTSDEMQAEPSHPRKRCHRLGKTPVRGAGHRHGRRLHWAPVRWAAPPALCSVGAGCRCRLEF